MNVSYVKYNVQNIWHGKGIGKITTLVCYMGTTTPPNPTMQCFRLRWAQGYLVYNEERIKG